MPRPFLISAPNSLSSSCFPTQLLLAMKSQLEGSSTTLDGASEPPPHSPWPASAVSSASQPSQIPLLTRLPQSALD